jgi:hypothetical protein
MLDFKTKLDLCTIDIKTLVRCVRNNVITIVPHDEMVTISKEYNIDLDYIKKLYNAEMQK